MIGFKQFIVESSRKSFNEKHVVTSFGRMNPPHAGHEQVVKMIHTIAARHGADHVVALTRSHDADKNPLSPTVKLKHVRRAFPGTNVQLVHKEAQTLIGHVGKLHDAGYHHLHLVAGQDRVHEFKRALNSVNAEHGWFKSVHVHSSGDRDPDAEGVEGISATKMREHARNSRKNDFISGVPSSMRRAHAEELYNAVKKGVGS